MEALALFTAFLKQTNKQTVQNISLQKLSQFQQTLIFPSAPYRVKAYL